MRKNPVGTVLVVALLGNRLRVAILIGLLFTLSGPIGIQGRLMGQIVRECRWTADGIDLDGDGQDDLEETKGQCSWWDPVLGYQGESYYSARALDGNTTWGGPDAESLPFGFQLGPNLPTTMNYLGGLPGVYAAELAGLSLGKPGGGLLHGWLLARTIPGRGMATEIYFANKTNEPIALGVPPEPRWRPTLHTGFTLLPTLSPDVVAQGILRRFGDGTPFFNGGVPAITADGAGRLWGIGSTFEPRSDSLFSMNENGGDFRIVASLYRFANILRYEIAIGSGGRVFIHSSDGPAPVYLFNPADHSLTNLRGGFITRPILSQLRKLSDGRLYGSTTQGYYRLDADGSGAAWHSLASTGVTNFNRGVIEPGNGWVYLLAQSGGPQNAGGIVRCRSDGQDASLWHPFGWNGAGESSALTLARDGWLYGYFQHEGQQRHYRVSLDGTLEVFANTGGWWNCEDWGKYCYSSGPPASMRGGWTEGADGRLYGITGDSRFNNSVPAIITLEAATSGEAGKIELRTQTRNSRLYRQEGQFSEIAWTATPSGRLVTGTQEGIMAISPGQHGVHPLRIFNPGGVDGRSPVGPLLPDGRGTLYGITRRGGLTDEGVMFSARTDGSGAAVIHTFTGGEGDVLIPSGFLAHGDDGWIYGTSQRGGQFDWVPKIYRAHPEQDRFEVVADLPGQFRRETDSPCGLVRSRSGDYYGTTPRGGAANLGTLFRFSATTRQVTVLHEFGLTPEDRWRAWPELLEARDGFLYGLTSGENTNQIGADGLFRLNPLTGEYRLLATVDRAADSTLYISGGLTETAQGDLFTVRTSSRAAWSDNKVLGEILRFVRPAGSDGPTRVEVVFRNAKGEEPYLSPTGRLVEQPDGRLFGLGTFSQTVGYYLDPRTGAVERAAREGFGELPTRCGSPVSYTHPHVMADGRVAVMFSWEYDQIRAFRLVRPPAPIALQPYEAEVMYGTLIQFQFGNVLFRNVGPEFASPNLPAGMGISSLALGSLNGTPEQVGTYRIEIHAGDGFWPPQKVTNTVTLHVSPRPVILSAHRRIVAAGSTNLAVTGSPGAFLPGDNIQVTWSTSATPDSPAGDYPIVPTISDPLNRLSNYVVTTNAAALRIVEPGFAAITEADTLKLRFAPAPGIKYLIEATDRLGDPWFRVNRFTIPPWDQPYFEFQMPTGYSNRFFRITQEP